MTERSSLLAETGIQPARHRHTSKTRICWADPAPTDRYATGGGSCVDGAQYRRRRHCWCHESPQGTRCVYCGRLRGFEGITKGQK